MNIQDIHIVIQKESVAERGAEAVISTEIVIGVIITEEAETEREIIGNTGVPCLGRSVALPLERV